MQNSYDKKRKNQYIDKNKNKKMVKSSISNDEEVCYKLINFEHPNALNLLIFNDFKHNNALSAINNLQNHYTRDNVAELKLDRICYKNRQEIVAFILIISDPHGFVDP